MNTEKQLSQYHEKRAFLTRNDYSEETIFESVNEDSHC